jgi:hypothetical protein
MRQNYDETFETKGTIHPDTNVSLVDSFDYTASHQH